MVLDIAIAQFRPVKADPGASLAGVEEALARAARLNPRPRLIVFPEATLTGYFLEGGVREHALPVETVHRELDERWSRAGDGEPIDLVIGFYELGDGRVFNSALYARLGGQSAGIRHVHRKVFLPTYGVFQEERFVEPGAGIAAFDTPLGRVAMLICEDAFHSISGTLAALDGAEIFLIPSASPARGARPGAGLPGNLARWDGLASALAREHGVFVVVSQLVGFEGGKGFAGGSTVFSPRGGLLVRGPLWEDALLPARLQREELLAARLEEPLLADLERAWIRLLIHSPGSGVAGPRASESETTEASAAPAHQGREDDDDRLTDDHRATDGDRAARKPEDAPGAKETAGAGETGGAAETAAVTRPPPEDGASRLPEPAAEVGRADARPAELRPVRGSTKGGRKAERERPIETDREQPGEAERGRPAEEEPPRFPAPTPGDPSPLEIDTALVKEWLLEFLREEIVRRRGFRRVVVGISGGVDSSLTAALCARALGAEAVTGLYLPYRSSSPESAEHARLVADWLGIERRTIDITGAVEGYLEEHEPDATPHRVGNVAARQRMIVLFDQAAKLDALPVGTGNKSERLLGYYTWHADDTPPINPLGDLFKVQVWALARALGIPEEVVEKPATADLIRGQTDEEDLGISYPEADLILYHLVSGQRPERLVELGFDPEKVALVRRRLEGTHWKRHLPTVAMLSTTAIGEWYLRPVDY